MHVSHPPSTCMWWARLHAYINVTTSTEFAQNLSMGSLLALYGSTVQCSSIMYVVFLDFFLLLSVSACLKKKTINATMCDTRLKGYYPLAVLNHAMLSVTTICSAHYLRIISYCIFACMGRQRTTVPSDCGLVPRWVLAHQGMACLQYSPTGSRPLPNACRKIEYSDHEYEVGEGVGDK